MEETNRDAAQEAISEDQYFDIEGEQPIAGEEPEADSQETPQKAESQEEAPKEDSTPAKEDSSRYEFWQSKFDHERNERERLEREYQEKLQKMESRFETFEEAQKPKEEPVKPPEPPRGYGTEDADPIEVMEYLAKKVDYQDKLLNETKGSWEQELQRRQQEQEANQQKAFLLGELQKNGLSQDESRDAFDMFSNPESFDIKNQVQYYKFLKAQKGLPQQQKFESKMKDPPPLPPGVEPGGKEEPEDEDFLSSIAQYGTNRRV